MLRGISARKHSPPPPILNVTVHYQSLCPFSRELLTSDRSPHNLLPLVRRSAAGGGRRVRLELVPYGHTNATPAGDFLCQHNESECFGNLFHGCVVRALPVDEPLLKLEGETRSEELSTLSVWMVIFFVSQWCPA